MFLSLYMKKYILILLVIISQNSISQIKFGTIEYKQIRAKELIEKEKSSEYAAIREVGNKIEKIIEKISYTLNFNTNEAYFFANKILVEGDVDYYNVAACSSRGKLKCYQNNSTKESRSFNDNKRTGIVIVNNEQKYDWSLLNETKIIDNYKCYKATTALYYNGKTYNDLRITAWYTPEIPVSFGPIGYGGLPGLILELQNDLGTFYVKKINLALDTAPEIDKLLSPKAVSQETYMQMVMGTLSKEQLEGMREAEEEEAKKK